MKAFIFDFAGVIINDIYWDWLRDVVPDLDKKKELLHKLSEQVDSSKITHEEFLQALEKETNVPKERIWEQVKDKTVLNQKLLTLIKNLKEKGYTIGLLSNYTSPWIREMLTEQNLYQYFDELVISSEHGVIKPDSEAFSLMLQHLSLRPEEVFFVDDRKPNVEAARELGIQAELYVDFEAFKEKLDLRGF